MGNADGGNLVASAINLDARALPVPLTAYSWKILRVHTSAASYDIVIALKLAIMGGHPFRHPTRCGPPVAIKSPNSGAGCRTRPLIVARSPTTPCGRVR